MTNAELITELTYCASIEKRKLLSDAADALEAAEQRIKELESQAAFFDAEKQNYQDNIEYRDERIKELEDDLRNSVISNPERFKIYGYTVKDLNLFAEICKRNNVKAEDMKQAAWNLELAVRAYRNSVIDGFKMEQTDKGTLSSYTLKPDFEKAFAEMRGEHDEQ